MTLLAALKERAGRLRRETYALYLAARHPSTPWYAKAFAAAVAAYAFSPIDLIPDFVPVLGYVDDLVLVPLGIAIAIRLVPPVVLAECRRRADQLLAEGAPVSRAAAVTVIVVWVLVALLLALWVLRVLQG